MLARMRHASRPTPTRRKAQKRTSQSRVSSRASLPTSVGAGGLNSPSLIFSLIIFELHPGVKVKEEAYHHRGEQREKNKPAPWRPRGFGVKRVGCFEHTVKHGFARANVRSIVDVLAQRVVNRFDGERICH